MGDNLCKRRFVLVHGANHGAWCWFKLKPLLEKAGHHVTVLDMAAAGINLKRIDELRTLRDYSEPLIQLMTSLPNDEKVIVVGHSLGGLNLALIMEMFPHKIHVAVFLAAFMPDSRHTPSYIFDQRVCHQKKIIGWIQNLKDPLDTFLFGPQFLSKLYRLSPREDLLLEIILRRPSSFFLNNISKPESKLSKERYGSVPRVYVMTDKDEAIPPSFQWWMIQNDEVKEVKQLKRSDHMSMISVPHQLCHCLLGIAWQYCQ